MATKLTALKLWESEGEPENAYIDSVLTENQCCGWKRKIERVRREKGGDSVRGRERGGEKRQREGEIEAER